MIFSCNYIRTRTVDEFDQHRLAVGTLSCVPGVVSIIYFISIHYANMCTLYRTCVLTPTIFIKFIWKNEAEIFTFCYCGNILYKICSHRKSLAWPDCGHHITYKKHSILLIYKYSPIHFLVYNIVYFFCFI